MTGLPTLDEAGDGGAVAHDPLSYLQGKFADYVEDRRREPRDDVLTKLAQATYPDGSIPDVDTVCRMATFLFAAGQDTTARLITAALRTIADDPEIQAYLRADTERIPNFVEEVLRHDGVVQAPPDAPRSGPPPSPASRSPPAPRSPSSRRRPTVIRPASRSPTSSVPIARTRTSTWPSGAASTPARVARCSRIEARVSHRAVPRPDLGHPDRRGAPRSARTTGAASSSRSTSSTACMQLHLES